jgi:hypothetical protein
LTYTEQRTKLLANIKAGVKERKIFMSLLPNPPAMLDYTIYHDLVSQRSFIFHKEELTDAGK